MGIWPMTAMGTFLTIPYQNHWNMTWDSYAQFPLQFLIKIIEMLPMTAKGFAKIIEIWHLPDW